MGKTFNLARMTTATTGAGTITLGAAVSGYLTFAQAGVVNLDPVSYGIKDGANSESGVGVYTSSGTTLTRVVTKSTNANAAISLSGSAEVYITPRAEDLYDGVAGTVRSLKILRGSATTLTITADEIVTETALGGQTFKQASASHTLTITGTGANGMDTGAAPTSGYLAVYSITKGDGTTFAVLGVNVATNNAPMIYPGASMPSGYVASALIGIWPTNASAQFPNGTQIGTHFYYPSLTMPALGTNLTAAVLTSISATAGIPPNPPGKIILADMVIFQTTASQRGALCAAGDATGTGFQGFNYASGAVASTGATSAFLPTTPVYSMSAFKGVPALTSQTLYWADAVGNAGNNVYVAGYDWGGA